MRILLLSAYDSRSHRRWREGLVNALPEHDWTVLTLPPRWFAWRIRGNSISWGIGQRELLQRGYDRVLATSMTDLAALRGLVPRLAPIPALVYFHENQFAYPPGEHPIHPPIEAQLVPLYSALAANRVLFNSAWNRDSFLQGARQLMRRMPDHVPPGLIDGIAARSRVLPVPLSADWFDIPSERDPSAPLNILWNHRWEYDKAPERLFAALDELQRRGIAFRLQLLGQRFRQVPTVFEQYRERLSTVSDHWGPLADEDAYRQALGRADVVVSTALHEFQGLAVLEAVAAGCLPLVPDRLAYSEFIPASFRYPSSPNDAVRESTRLADRLARLAADKAAAGLPTPPHQAALKWDRLADSYQHELEAC